MYVLTVLTSAALQWLSGDLNLTSTRLSLHQALAGVRVSIGPANRPPASIYKLRFSKVRQGKVNVDLYSASS